MFNDLTIAICNLARQTLYFIIDLILRLNSPDPKILGDPDPRLTFNINYTDDAGDLCDAADFFFDETEWESEKFERF